MTVLSVLIYGIIIGSLISEMNKLICYLDYTRLNGDDVMGVIIKLRGILKIYGYKVGFQ